MHRREHTPGQDTQLHRSPSRQDRAPTFPVPRVTHSSAWIPQVGLGPGPWTRHARSPHDIVTTEGPNHVSQRGSKAHQLQVGIPRTADVLGGGRRHWARHVSTVFARSHGAHGYLWKSYRKALSTLPSFLVWLTGDCGNTAHVRYRFSITRALEGSSRRHRGHRPHAVSLGPSRNLPLSTGCRPHGTRKQFPTNHARRDSGENTCPLPSDTCLPALHPLTVPVGQLKGVDRPQGGNVPEAPPPGPRLRGDRREGCGGH